MHSVTIFSWDTNPYLHWTLIGINILMLMSLIIRFEWKLFRNRFVKNAENTNSSNKHQKNLQRTNGLHPQTNKSNPSLQHVSVQTVSHTQSPHSIRRTSQNDDDLDGGGHTVKNVIFRESAANTLGIQVNTNPSTPSATPTPIPNTPDMANMNNMTMTTSVQTPQNMQKGGSDKSFPSTASIPHNNPTNTNQPPLPSLPSGSKIAGIQLTKVRSGKDIQIDIEDEQNVITYPNDIPRERMEMDIFNKTMAEDALSNLNKISTNAFKNTCISAKRRRASIEFYKQLFNANNFDDNGKLLTAKKRKQRRNKLNRTRKRHSYRNDSWNLEEHQRSFRMHSDDDIDTLDEREVSMFDDAPQINHVYNGEDHDYNTMIRTMNSSSVTLGHLLQSKIYDDEDKQSVRNRYRYILYFPMLIYIIFGAACLILYKLEISSELYLYIMYGYPALEIVLSIVLWCQIDIVILSCGGSNIVEECLEVQISANAHEFKCIYCCWCDCAVLRWCNSCTHDNGYSLFKCHHKFMKILICLLCPFLTIIYYIIAEIEVINHALLDTKIGAFQNDDGHTDHYHTHSHDEEELTVWEEFNNSSVYWLIFILVSLVYVALIFTAIYIGMLIVKSLHSLSSLTPHTLTKQYITSIAITFVMQIQFVVILLYFNLDPAHMDDIDIHHMGLCTALPFYMILIYVEFIMVAIFNHFAFRNDDFIKFGMESIKRNEVQLFDFQPDFNTIHDLHNYRRIYNERFLWDIDHKNEPFQEALSPDTQIKTKNYNLLHIDPNADELDDHKVKQKRKKNKKKKMTTPLITNRGIITIEDSKRPSITVKRRKSMKKSKKSARHLVKKKSKQYVNQKDSENETKHKDKDKEKEKAKKEIELESIIETEKDIKSRPESTREDNKDNFILGQINNEPISMHNHYDTTSVSTSIRNGTFTQTTFKETAIGHHHPTTTSITSLSLDLNVNGIAPYSVDKGHDDGSSTDLDDEDDDSWNDSNDDEEKAKKKKTKKAKKNKSRKGKKSDNLPPEKPKILSHDSEIP